MREALSATLLRRPVLVFVLRHIHSVFADRLFSTENDQLLIIGDGSPPLQQMLNPVHLAPGSNKKTMSRNRVFSLMRPCEALNLIFVLSTGH
jgi:hypothetical protein